VPQRNAASGPQPVQRSQAPAPAPSAPQAVPPSGQFSGAAQAGGGIAELLESAGIDQATAQALASPQMSQMLGMILRVTVRGLMDVLNARAEIKSQFRVSVTKIAPTENNPLKFCVDERDALQRLLHPGHGFLGPVEAVDEAFEDVKAHQMAMMAGMRAAFDQLMERFNPELLQKQFDRQLGRSLLPLNKNRYWDMLQELYADISRDSDANFARLFGDAFASAYEEQMEQLNLLRRRAQAGAADRNVR
jgi:type VI secretion system FHA domain protein